MRNLTIVDVFNKGDKIREKFPVFKFNFMKKPCNFLDFLYFKLKIYMETIFLSIFFMKWTQRICIQREG